MAEVLDDGETPVALVDQAAKEAFDTVKAVLGRVGGKARHIFIVIDGEDLPEGEINATLAGHNYDGPEDLFAELLDHAEQVGRKIGASVNVLRTPTVGQG